ncbi:MAG TPA: N-acetylmuramoyl-L-alanine amidase, partial [Candidatus Polarisedimenticolaceae bacterium]|nr:N-acetylmuramoyl-L-alanine amidase [Candidatus Polarisedimenticolaceae bacterium]
MKTKQWMYLLFELTSLVVVASLPAATVMAEPSVSKAPYSASGKTTIDGQPLLTPFVAQGALSFSAQPQITSLQPKQQPECPPELMFKCHFVPAAYTQNDPNDKSIYGNYDLANRPNGGLVSQPGVNLGITGIVQHDTEGSLASTLALFQNPTSYVSAHYVIDTDGQIYQTVRTKDIAWHAGNWYTNMH